jgi:hypothetical protein
MVAMLGDSMFNYSVDRMVKLHANKVVVLGFLGFSDVTTYLYLYKPGVDKFTCSTMNMVP